MKKTEKTNISIGFMPLSDCAPLVVAQELGYFNEQHLQVELVRQNSWATLRDKLGAGILDMAQMLAPMPIACQLGLGVSATAMCAPMVLSYNGNGITLSAHLFDEIIASNQLDVNEALQNPLSAEMLLPLVKSRRDKGQEKLRFAAVFPHSCHYYQLASWLFSGGIGLNDVDISIIPPAAMVDALVANQIDGFCVGAPWNAAAVRVGIGVTVVTSKEIWHNSPEKVLGVTNDWAKTNPKTLKATVLALQKACDWLTDIPNRFEAARWLAQEQYVGTSLDNITPALIDSCLTKDGCEPRRVTGHTLFSIEDTGNSPRVEQALWLMLQMQRCGQILMDGEPDEEQLTAITGIYAPISD